jgi:CRP/FNR family cyclic AMP-dependent transcriptional regulator
MSKINPQLIGRFTTRSGKRKLIEKLLEQYLINGDNTIATAVAKVIQLKSLKKDKKLTVQGGNDNEIYFILSGSVSINVNQRVIASRSNGEHVGEMAMMDSTARRSATVVANEDIIVAKMTEWQFTKLAKTYPVLWQRMATNLVKRLKERNKFQTIPRSEPTIFIGSSSEGLKIAQSINKYLLGCPVVPKIWTNGVFEASKTAIEDLMKINSESDFAIIILTPDDITKSRSNKKAAPRDNVIFELGLFFGGLGRERTYLISPKGLDIKIPTDLLGVTRLEYQKQGRGTLAKRLSKVKKEIYQLINKYGPR